MTEGELAGSAEERDLFLVALRSFSETCEAPGLHPSCPFSEEVEPGLRGCGEECMDLLGRHKAPLPSTVIDLGDGMSIVRQVRPRVRRVLQPEGKAFDAQEIYLDDQAKGQPTGWRLTSLLRGFEERVLEPPPDDPDHAEARLNEICRLASLLESRGIEVEPHVGPRLRHRVFEAMMSHLAPALVAEHDSPKSHAARRWLELLSGTIDPDALPEESASTRQPLFSQVVWTVAGWAQTAELDHLYSWTPPARVAEEPHQEMVARDPAHSDGLWIVDRFSATYLADWPTESLRKEWLYLHGRIEPPCPSSEMRTREVDETELAKVMADRLTQSPASSTTALTPRLVQPAVAFLTEGRRSEAAALFEAVLRLEPSNGDAINNLGFCLLPDEPARAVDLFDQALSQDLPAEQLTLLNRALALLALGRRPEILTPHSRDGEAASGTSWLWDVESVLSADREPELIECTDLNEYQSDLHRIAGTLD